VSGCLHRGSDGICNVFSNCGDIPVFLRGGYFLRFLELLGLRIAVMAFFGCRIALEHLEFTNYAAEFTCDASGRWVYGSFKFPYLA
jgi:hypothetical protein